MLIWIQLLLAAYMDLVKRLPPVTERVCHSDTVTKAAQVWANLTSGLATTIKAKTNKYLTPTADIWAWLFCDGLATTIE